jgi:hypothetical protein
MNKKNRVNNYIYIYLYTLKLIYRIKSNLLKSQIDKYSI